MPSVQLHKLKVEKANTATLQAVTRVKSFVWPAGWKTTETLFTTYLFFGAGISLSIFIIPRWPRGGRDWLDRGKKTSLLLDCYQFYHVLSLFYRLGSRPGFRISCFHSGSHPGLGVSSCYHLGATLDSGYRFFWAFWVWLGSEVQGQPGCLFDLSLALRGVSSVQFPKPNTLNP